MVVVRVTPPSPLALLRLIKRNRFDWRFSCVDCGVNVERIGEYFVVLDQVWQIEARLDPQEGMYCVGCLESRINRRLCPGDFMDVPANGLRYWRESGRWPSRRLQERMGLLEPGEPNGN